MAAYVIKSWRAGDTPDAQSNFISIVGRRQGLISWLLALFGIDPIMMIMVSGTRIEFAETSLSGSVRRLIPLPSVCSTVYGYHKPWQKAIGVGLFLFALIAQGMLQITHRLNVTTALVPLAVAVLGAIIYYFLNRTLTLGFIENSGHVSAIQFKRSVVENQDINEVQAGYVCQVVQYLVETRQRAIHAA